MKGIDPREQIKYAEVDNNEVVEINYTSGTTGFSKGVVLSANSLAGNVDFAMRSIELNAGEKMLALLPLAHCYGCAFDFLFPHGGGGACDHPWATPGHPGHHQGLF